ncbi:TPA: substrate-binding domain-containing protein [Klebsiella pneumoniae]|jgi:LacI family transcriptional regulator|uniref:LacI family transcriptional regulator n=1 Tax=Tolumonas osonensis TaxID=675874 RepID=A0A841GAJ9_9GAMM|nr:MULTISPECIES: substrate-binding domain-containing protein [Gammaproteobacteria]EBR1431346.1 LacI family DNA-binding transcriptional regulator [Salmonella enterica]EIY1307578.1 substrate-binding domain-containing protein [Enterobacter hormaechei]EIY2678401.1 substrate-binding domain-containing protein [Raoultella planticola]EKM0529258.1 substrate-binding domain-containing protein [Cronobacter turicensis]ELP0887808.1 substrate-binding domain-containing protein [Klebsiella oxytoca]
MATIKDVARLAGVSVATVSRVLNNSSQTSPESREAVKKAMDELKYHPNANARALSHQGNETLGIVVADVSSPFFGIMVKAVDQVAYDTGNFLLVGNGYHDAKRERKAIEQLLRHQCAGIVVHAMKLSDEELAHFMDHVPGMVIISRTVPGYESRCVNLDNRFGAALATNHLIQQGHRSIAYIGSMQQIADAIERQQGYTDALIQNGIPVDERLIIQSSPDELGGERAVIELLNQGRKMTGIVCYNDPIAVGALSTLIDNDIKVPNQISVIGFDDVLINYLQPRLTTIRYPVVEMARQAARLAIALAHGEPAPDVTNLFTPTLVRRYSVAPAVSS